MRTASNPTQDPVTRETDCRFVTVLTTPADGIFLGYRFGGTTPGPDVMVTGDTALIAALFVRLKQLPTLPWLWGRLYLTTLEGTDAPEFDAEFCGVHFDEILLLPHTKGLGAHQTSVEHAYWTTLRLCRQFGMIAGRGVSSR